jgi:hypothetical protein
VKVPLFSAVPLLAAILWAGALAAAPGHLAPVSIVLVAGGSMATATVGMVGITVTGGRWAHRTALGSLGATLVLAVVRPVDGWWVAALLCSLLGGVVLLSPAMTRGIRRLPAASGPPLRAVLIPLFLLGFPFVLGLAAWDRPSAGTAVIGATAPLAALWYARVLPGGLLAVRVGWPALAVGLAFTQWVAPALISLAAGVATASLAWHSSVRVAFHPPRALGTAHPIPPELTPREVLDAAELDERGRPRR